MVTQKIKQIQEYSAKIEALQKEIEKQRNLELARLPEKYGFTSIPAFVKAVRAAAGGRGASGGKRRKRAKITPEMKQKIKGAVNGGKTGMQIAKEFGISLPSVQNIKKELGLVKA